jgi:hypothetical protein
LATIIEVELQPRFRFVVSDLDLAFVGHGSIQISGFFYVPKTSLSPQDQQQPTNYLSILLQARLLMGKCFFEYWEARSSYFLVV